ARGHTVEVFTTSIDGAENSAVPHGEPVMLDGVKVRYFASHVLRRLAFVPALARDLRREMPGTDLVHLHSVFLWPTWAAARRARKHRVPYLISPRGMLVKKLIEQRHRRLKTAWIGVVEQANLENAAAVHVTSAAEAAELQKFGFRLRRVAMVPNGVDAPAAASVGEPAADVEAVTREQPLILFFGRLSWVKGLDRLLQGLARSRAGTLAIIGTDYDHLAPRLLRLAANLDIASRVRLLPRTVTGADKEAVFAAARALVLPSRSGSFGNAVLEAMQRGLPAIVTRDVGAADIVRAAGGGFVVDGTPAALGEAIEQLAADPSLARAMGEAGRRYVQEHCGWANVAAEMEAVYASLRA